MEISAFILILLTKQDVLMPLCFSAVCCRSRGIHSMWESQEFYIIKKRLSEMTLLELWKPFTITLFSERQAGAENKLP